MVVPSLPDFGRTDLSYRLLLLFVVIALVLIAAFFRNTEARKVMPTVISCSLVLTAFAVDRLFTNKLAVHSHSMNWSANGVVPWGQAETDEKGEPPVVIYRKVDHGYCYDAIFSPELKAELIKANKPVITAEYNVFSDFGRERNYNIRSVDGLLFHEGDRLVRSADFSGGTVLEGSGPADCQR